MTARTFALATVCAAFAALAAGPAAGSAPAGRYGVTASGDVYDNATKLTWQRTVKVDNTLTQAGAVQYCNSLNANSASGWRVPTIVELRSLVDRSGTPTIDSYYFPGTPSDMFFWTSTPVAGAALYWVVDFGAGTSSGDGANDQQLVRCVH